MFDLHLLLADNALLGLNVLGVMVFPLILFIYYHVIHILRVEVVRYYYGTLLELRRRNPHANIGN